jgi:hypothetical protein
MQNHAAGQFESQESLQTRAFPELAELPDGDFAGITIDAGCCIG